jgi:hypothetical protein
MGVMPSRTACVYFTHPQRGQFGPVTAGSSVMETAANALGWFTDPHWRGPRPGPDTVLDVSLVGDGRTWHVRAGRVMAFHRPASSRPSNWTS